MRLTPSSKTILAINQTIDVIKENKISTIRELLEFLGCLGIELGKSMISSTAKDISKEELEHYQVIEQLYLEQNNIGAATVLQGMLLLNWQEQLDLIKK